MKTNQSANRVMALALLLALLFLAAGCDSAKREQQELVRLKQKKMVMLDKLYAEYGGSPLSATIKKEIAGTKNAPSPEAAEGASHVVESLDRAAFENHVLSLGGGERPFVLSKKARDFFARKDVRKKAVQIYEMDLRINYLQQSLESRARTSGY